MKIALRIFLLAWPYFISQSEAISIDNDIIGEPDIECLEEDIRIWVKTRKVFAGRIYAKGRAEVEECYKDDFDRDHTTKPNFNLKFGLCGMKSLRSVDPRGMYYAITIVVSFHPLFITKVDQAFHVKCFFEEANHGLTAELGVSMIPTTEVEARHGIPGCSYSIHRSSIDDLDAGRPAGEAIQYASVGDKVLHQWHCNDKMFGVLINNCYVTDGFGKKADVIDGDGCPVDPILITGIRYSTDLQRAYAESYVFKFADKPAVWFFCQIQMCMKKAGMCTGVSPPKCASVAPGKSGGGGGNGGRGGDSEDNSDYEVETTTVHRKRTTPASSKSDYEDYEQQTRELKLHSPVSSPYQTTQASDYDQPTEPVTAFGPAFPIEEDGTIAKHLTTTSESVSQTFEAEDDLATPAAPPSSLSKGKKTNEKGDYNDYDEVTIPPNLTDLLANLPDDLSAESIKKMLRDSVSDDREALLESFEKIKSQMKQKSKKNKKKQPSRIMRDLRPGDLHTGDKVDEINVEWMSTRRRDVPLDDYPSSADILMGDAPSADDKPRIAGQLMVYELDEEPPEMMKKKLHGLESNSTCIISRSGLMILATGLSLLSASLFLAVLFMLHKGSRKDKTSCNSSISDDLDKRYHSSVSKLYGKY